MTMLRAHKGWVLEVAMIARIVLASTLLLNACTLIFERGSRMKLVSLVELFLGAIIAVGWETRYAAGLVLLGTLAASLWLTPLYAVLAESQPAVQALILSSFLLICFGRNNAFKDKLSITEKGRLPNSAPNVISLFRQPDAEISVFLEPRSSHRLDNQTCTGKTGKEDWYAKHHH